MRIVLDGVRELRFGDGTPVRAASGVAPFGGGFLVAQDDATHAAWFREGRATPVRLVPARQGKETFDEASGTKHLKPDLEAACEVTTDGARGVLLLGSGSSPERMRWSLVHQRDEGTDHRVADLAPLYDVVAGVLDVPLDLLNMEGACVLGTALRWYHRGMPSAGWPSRSVDLPLGAAVDAVLGRAAPADVPVTHPVTYHLGAVDDVGLAITDAIALPDGAVLVSAAAEDSPHPRDDGPVVASALALVRDGVVGPVVELPRIRDEVSKVEGLMLVEVGVGEARVLAVADADDPGTASVAVELRVRY
jgi:hypothetical protein